MGLSTIIWCLSLSLKGNYFSDASNKYAATKVNILAFPVPNLTAVIISLCVSNYHAVYFKYIQFLFLKK